MVSLGLSELGFGRIVEMVVSEAARHGGEASVHRGRRGASERQSTPRATQPSHMSTCPLSMKRTGVAGILGEELLDFGRLVFFGVLGKGWDLLFFW